MSFSFYGLQPITLVWDSSPSVHNISPQSMIHLFLDEIDRRMITTSPFQEIPTIGLIQEATIAATSQAII